MAVALACSVGLHWSFLQSFAWTTMLVDNLAIAPLSTAIQRTFDGKHPCALCKAVAEGRQSEKKSDSAFSLKKFEGLNSAPTVALFQPASFPIIRGREPQAQASFDPPPLPPPRAA